MVLLHWTGINSSYSSKCTTLLFSIENDASSVLEPRIWSSPSTQPNTRKAKIICMEIETFERTRRNNERLLKFQYVCHRKFQINCGSIAHILLELFRIVCKMSLYFAVDVTVIIIIVAWFCDPAKLNYCHSNRLRMGYKFIYIQFVNCPIEKCMRINWMRFELQRLMCDVMRFFPTYTYMPRKTHVKRSEMRLLTTCACTCK